MVNPSEPVDASDAARALEQLHAQVIDGKRRIEITCIGSDERCVIISKAELESLERALELLADQECVKALAESIAQLAAAHCGASGAAPGVAAST